jgi:signal transduction histidine kinase
MRKQTFKLFGITGRGYTIGFAVWTMYAATAAAFTALGTGFDYWLLLSSELLQGYVYGLFTIPVWLFVTTFAVTRSRLEQFAWHVAVAPLYATSGFGVYATLFYVAFGNATFQSARFSETWIFQFFQVVLIYGVVASLFHVIHSQRTLREKEKAQLALELYAKQAELATLKAQLNPHFLFNALNTINALIGLNPDAAREVLSTLSDVLRYTLESDKQEFVPLADELRFVEHYIEIEKARFQHRLSVEYDIDDAARTCFIPPMLLQPLVENAVRHGIAPKPDGGKATLRVALQGERLRIEVSDDGLGIGAPRSNGTGKGLYNTERRLQKMFGDASKLLVESSASGFRVSFHLPVMRLSNTQLSNTQSLSESIHEIPRNHH